MAVKSAATSTSSFLGISLGELSAAWTATAENGEEYTSSGLATFG